MKIFCFIFLMLTIATSCRSNSPADTIVKTSNSIIQLIKENNLSGFKSIIGFDLPSISKTEEQVEMQFAQWNHYINLNTNKSVPFPIVEEGFSEMGSKKVKIVIFQGDDVATNVSEIDLVLYFGPPRFVSLDKISDYDVILKRIKQFELQAPPKIVH